MKRYTNNLTIVGGEGGKRFCFDNASNQSTWGHRSNPSVEAEKVQIVRGPTLHLRCVKTGRLFQHSNNTSVWVENDDALPTILPKQSSSSSKGIVQCKLARTGRTFYFNTQTQHAYYSQAGFDFVRAVQFVHGLLRANLDQDLDAIWSSFGGDSMDSIEGAFDTGPNPSDDAAASSSHLLMMLHQALLLTPGQFQTWANGRETSSASREALEEMVKALHGRLQRLGVSPWKQREEPTLARYFALPSAARVQAFIALAKWEEEHVQLDGEEELCAFQGELLGECEGVRYWYFPALAPNRLYAVRADDEYELLCHTSRLALMECLQALVAGMEAGSALAMRLQRLREQLMVEERESKASEQVEDTRCVLCNAPLIVVTQQQQQLGDRCGNCIGILPPVNGPQQQQKPHSSSQEEEDSGLEIISTGEDAPPTPSVQRSAVAAVPESPAATTTTSSAGSPVRPLNLALILRVPPAPQESSKPLEADEVLERYNEPITSSSSGSTSGAGDSSAESQSSSHFMPLPPRLVSSPSDDLSQSAMTPVEILPMSLLQQAVTVAGSSESDNAPTAAPFQAQLETYFSSAYESEEEEEERRAASPPPPFTQQEYNNTYESSSAESKTNQTAATAIPQVIPGFLPSTQFTSSQS